MSMKVLIKIEVQQCFRADMLRSFFDFPSFLKIVRVAAVAARENETMKDKL